MGYSAPPTKSVGNTLTAADWNTYIRDNLVDLAARLLPTGGAQVFGPGTEFTTVSTSYVDITGAVVNLTTTRQSTLLAIASGWIRADAATYMTSLVGVIGGVADANPIIKDCVVAPDDTSYTPFGYVFWKAAVAAGVTTVKLQLKTSNAAMTARAGNLSLFVVGIPEV